MSDLLTHWAVFEDIRRLMNLDPRASRDLAAIIEGERQYARLGSVSRGGARFVPHVLRAARQQWAAAQRAGGAAADLLARRIAFALGGITHYPTDFLMKPLMSRLAGADWNRTHHEMQAGTAKAEALDAIQEISVYYDVEVFRRVYLAGREDPFNRFLFADNSTTPGKALEEFVTTLFQRALLAAHTLAPDRHDVDGWLDNLIGQVQPLYLSVERYVRVFREPDPDKVRRYGVATEFYRADDPAVVAARAAQAGAPVGSLDEAVREGANRGCYGEAVALGVRCMRQVSDFWEGRSDELPDISQG